MRIKLLSSYRHFKHMPEVGKTVKAIRKRTNKDKDNWCEKPFYFIPITDGNIKEGAVFVRGKGWMDIKKAKVFEIPTYEYNGNNQSLQDYAKEYGVEALHYSITGQQIDFWEYNIYNEFCSLLQNPNQLELYKDDTLIKVYDSLLKAMTLGYDKLEKEFKVYGKPYVEIVPQFVALGKLIKPIYMNTMLVNTQLEIIYKQWRGNILTEEKKKLYGIEIMDNDIKGLFDEWSYIEPTNEEELNEKTRIKTLWDKMVSERRHLMTTIIEEVGKQVAMELETNNGIFPTTIKDRLRFFFGEDVAKKYEILSNLCQSVK